MKFSYLLAINSESFASERFVLIEVEHGYLLSGHGHMSVTFTANVYELSGKILNEIYLRA